MDADAIARFGALGAVLTAGAKAQQARKATNGKANAAEGQYTVVEGLEVVLKLGNQRHAEVLELILELDRRLRALESRQAR